MSTSMNASVNSPSKSFLNNMNNDFNIDKLNANKSNLIGEHRRRLSDLSLEKDDLNKSLIDSHSLKKTSNHQFSSNINQQQTSQSSTNLNSLSSYSKPFSYHLPNNRDFNFTSSSNLNSSLLNKPNSFANQNSIRNSTSAIDSSIGISTNLGHNQLSTNTAGYFGPMDSGLGSTTSGTGSGTNSGSSGRTTSSSTSTVTAKKSVGWASNNNLNSQDNLNNQSPTSRLNTSLIGNTSSSTLISNNLSLIGNTNTSSSKYSSDYLSDKYSNDSPTRYNYSSILDNKTNNRSNVLIGSGSLIGNDTSSKYSDLNKKYDSYG